VPTNGEFRPGAQVNDGLGIWPAAGTRVPVVAPLRAEINPVLAMPDVGECIARGAAPSAGSHPQGNGRREHARLDYSGDD